MRRWVLTPNYFSSWPFYLCGFIFNLKAIFLAQSNDGLSTSHILFASKIKSLLKIKGSIHLMKMYVVPYIK